MVKVSCGLLWPVKVPCREHFSRKMVRQIYIESINQPSQTITLLRPGCTTIICTLIYETRREYKENVMEPTDHTSASTSILITTRYHNTSPEHDSSCHLVPARQRSSTHHILTLYASSRLSLSLPHPILI